MKVGLPSGDIIITGKLLADCMDPTISVPNMEEAMTTIMVMSEIPKTTGKVCFRETLRNPDV